MSRGPDSSDSDGGVSTANPSCPSADGARAVDLALGGLLLRSFYVSPYMILQNCYILSA